MLLEKITININYLKSLLYYYGYSKINLSTKFTA
jgi:hypothetical protein